MPPIALAAEPSAPHRNGSPPATPVARGEAPGFATYMEALERARARLARRLCDAGLGLGQGLGIGLGLERGAGPGLGCDDAPARKAPMPGHSTFSRTWRLGEWAERAVARGIRASGPLTCVRIDAAATLPVGAHGFETALVQRRAERAARGKRPDLLVAETARPGTPLGAIEVRASAYHLGRHYQAQAARGTDRSLSFTLKLEDLSGLYRWIAVHRMPQTHVQVFLDGAHAINVLRLFETLAYADRLPRPRTDGGNQAKPTFHVPIEQGVEIGVFAPEPRLAADALIDATGKGVAVFWPDGGELHVNASALREEMTPHRPAVPY